MPTKRKRSFNTQHQLLQLNTTSPNTSSNIIMPHPSSSSSSSSLPPRPSFGRGRGAGGFSSSFHSSSSNKRQKHSPVSTPQLSPPVHDINLVNSLFPPNFGNPRNQWVDNPKAVMNNYCVALVGNPPFYKVTDGLIGVKRFFRAELIADPTVSPPIIGLGDAENRKEAEKLAALSACLQLGAKGMFDRSNLPASLANGGGNGVGVGVGVGVGAGSGGRIAMNASTSNSSAMKRPGSKLPNKPLSGPASKSAKKNNNNNNNNNGTTPSNSTFGQNDPSSSSSDNTKNTNTTTSTSSTTTAPLSTTGRPITLELARSFLDYYCKTYKFDRPDIKFSQPLGSHAYWNAVLFVGGSKIGMAKGRNKKDAQGKAFVDTVAYLDHWDGELWKGFEMDQKRGGSGGGAGGKKDGGGGGAVMFSLSPELEDDLRDSVEVARGSRLFAHAEEMEQRERRKRIDALNIRNGGGAGGNNNGTTTGNGGGNGIVIKSGTNDKMDIDLPQSTSSKSKSVVPGPPPNAPKGPRGGGGGGGGGGPSQATLKRKSEDLLSRLKSYQIDEKMSKIRQQRESLPVTADSSSVLAKISTNQVTIVMASTGSGKTTQIPQLIFDDYISDGKGAECNIVCTQPRRIAAISVAERVAKERGEGVGDSVGYQVRFDAKVPKRDGSILFCTTGIFLKRLQGGMEREAAANVAANGNNQAGGGGGNNNNNRDFLDGVTHVVVDEVHERDVDTDLLLFILRRNLEQRKAAGLSMFKVVLMSATIDPHLFERYFNHAPVIEVPGRAFPVERFYLNDINKQLRALQLPQNKGGWAFNDRIVDEFLNRELGPPEGFSIAKGRFGIESMEIPFPLIALIIAWVMSKTDDGHILTFLPGWDEIKKVEGILIDPVKFPLLGIDFRSPKFEIHLLHSTIPVIDQQRVFEPPPPGVRRLILSTNIAETSVTIPDVCYVIDSGVLREKRYDPERHLSSLVTAWVGTSNLNQRAGRAGRHRQGEYYGLVSKGRYDTLDVHSTVEMKRSEISSTCMHILSLNLPIEVEDVLAQCIEPPEPERVVAAMEMLQRLGAVNLDRKLTPLGRVLLQLPVEAAIGKLCLLGSFFRCLDKTLTLAAILTNRDPFLSPILLKQEADRVKNSWAPTEFRSDILGILRAYDAWWEYQGRGDYGGASRFATDNFLSKPTLLMMQKVKTHLLESLDRAGVLGISGGNEDTYLRFRRGTQAIVPDALNTNQDSLPLLASLIAVAVAPNFAVRTSAKAWKTKSDRVAFMHPSSVNHNKRENESDLPVKGERQLYAFLEKTQSLPQPGKDGRPSNSEGMMSLRSTTRLDPLGYMLFGASDLRVVDAGLECDGWLSIQGHVAALDDVERLRKIVDLSLLRVFEGLESGIGAVKKKRWEITRPMDDEDDRRQEGEDDGYVDAGPLAPQEILDLNGMATRVSNLLAGYAAERSRAAPGTRPGSSMSTRPGSSLSRSQTPVNSRPTSAIGYRDNHRDDRSWRSSASNWRSGGGGGSSLRTVSSYS